MKDARHSNFSGRLTAWSEGIHAISIAPLSSSIVRIGEMGCRWFQNCYVPHLVRTQRSAHWALLWVRTRCGTKKSASGARRPQHMTATNQPLSSIMTCALLLSTSLTPTPTLHNTPLSWAILGTGTGTGVAPPLCLSTPGNDDDAPPCSPRSASHPGE